MSATLIDVAVVTSELFAAIFFCSVFPNDSRFLCYISMVVNLITIGGWWGFMTYLTTSGTCFVAAEIGFFTVMTLRWNRPIHLALAWLSMLGWITILSILYKPESAVLVASVVFAVYSRFMSRGPARVLLLTFEATNGNRFKGSISSLRADILILALTTNHFSLPLSDVFW